MPGAYEIRLFVRKPAKSPAEFRAGFRLIFDWGISVERSEAVDDHHLHDCAHHWLVVFFRHFDAFRRFRGHCIPPGPGR